MKAFYEATARLRIEIDAPGIKELFADLATVQEIFGSDPRCEVCDSEARCQHRIVDDNHYYELVCTNQQCRARLSFGQHKKGGGLFPKRKDEDGNWIPNRGWAKWEASRTAAESATPEPKAQPEPASGDMAELLAAFHARFGGAPRTLGEALDIMRRIIVENHGDGGGQRADRIMAKYRTGGATSVADCRLMLNELRALLAGRA